VENEEKPGLAVRARMRSYVSAVFWQEYEIGEGENDRAVKRW
jgi:hypothetical protein